MEIGYWGLGIGLVVLDPAWQQIDETGGMWHNESWQEG